MKKTFMMLVALLMCLLLSSCGGPSFAADLAPVCTSASGIAGAGTQITTGMSPAIIISSDGGVSGWNNALPSEWRAGSLEETVYVVCLGEVVDHVIQTCYYTPPPNVDRHQTDRAWVLREAATGNEVARGTISGTPARQCHNTEAVSLTDLYGADPTSEDLMDDIRSYVTTSGAGGGDSK